MLVNGMTDVICDQQMALHCGNESSLHSLSSQMSLNSHSSNAHLAPLQQLDSFTTVFATNPSTPLSVVSDLHSYEHSSSLSLIPHTSSDVLSSSVSTEQKPFETSVVAETSPNPEVDSPIVSSSSSLQTSTSTDTNSNFKDKSKVNSSSHDLSESTATENNQPNSVVEVSESSEAIVDGKSNETTEVNSSDNSNDNKITDESDINPNVTSSENSCVNDNTVKTEDSSSSIISCEEPTIAAESKPTTVESVNGSQNNKVIDSTESRNQNEVKVTNDQEIGQPMEFGHNAPNDNNSDITDYSDKNSDSNPMDETLSQSDQSEPMDED